MAKVTITKKLVEENSQLAELLAERNIEVGSKIEQSELDELTQEHFDAEPALTDKGFEVGQVIRVKKKAEVEDLEKPKSYKVISRFRDQNNEAKIYEIGEEVPVDFEESRIASLLERKLISEA